MTVRIATAVAVAAVALAALGALGSRPNPDPPEVAAIPVATTSANRVTSYARTRTYTGIVRAARTSEIGFERVGRLQTVLVEEGNHVEEGQILARLDTRNLKAKRREFAAERAAAQARLDEFVAGPRQETIAAARAEVQDLASQLKLFELNHDRREKLLREQATSREEYEQSQLGMYSTEARLEAARQRLKALEDGTRREQIDAQRAVVERLDASVENVEVDLAESSLVAPYAGKVAVRFLDEGTIVSPDDPLFRLVEDARLEAWIGLPPETAARLTAGKLLQVDVKGIALEARLQRLLPELDARTRTCTVIFAIAGPPGTVVPGQVARITLREPTAADGFWLPTTALTRGTRGLWSVLVVETAEKAAAAKRDVELLHTEGDRVLVRGTLREGDQVVVSGTHRLVAGQQVQVVN